MSNKTTSIEIISFQTHFYLHNIILQYYLTVILFILCNFMQFYLETFNRSAILWRALSIVPMECMHNPFILSFVSVRQ